MSYTFLQLADLNTYIYVWLVCTLMALKPLIAGCIQTRTMMYLTLACILNEYRQNEIKFPNLRCRTNLPSTVIIVQNCIVLYSIVITEYSIVLSVT